MLVCSWLLNKVKKYINFFTLPPSYYTRLPVTDLTLLCLWSVNDRLEAWDCCHAPFRITAWNVPFTKKCSIERLGRTSKWQIVNKANKNNIDFKALSIASISAASHSFSDYIEEKNTSKRGRDVHQLYSPSTFTSKCCGQRKR